ncbi:Molybdopterin synthase catalytic subunit [Glutinoglossum americanum]|uniref:Molybdopterin synthase catalytic subunit n=1 Tax=Glutinoglossum americanum TaxID=1670608 RepID=A0A9P8L041_9PEZI|nr:Molybdopterin synthase catalytic subunit [Glutinoglossum americanum]
MSETGLPQVLREGENIYAELTRDHLDVQTTINRVKSPKAGAIVLFAGTTRDSFESRPVLRLTYTSYVPLALTTLLAIAKSVHTRHALTAISITHRLGRVPIGEESILVAVSAPHRQAAWRAGEEALEECKNKVEIWKREEFDGEDGGVWRANSDAPVGRRQRRASLEDMVNVEDGEQEDR